MKILLISEKDEIKKKIDKLLSTVKIECIHYFNPIKAMDNIEEVSPGAVIFSANDFPRHWKVFLVFLRSLGNKEKIPFILLKGSDFDYSEVSKATFLGVNGIIDESLGINEDLDRLKEIINRYKRSDTEILFPSINMFSPSEDQKVALLFMHPEKLNIISGIVVALSETELHFMPSNLESTSLKNNLVFHDCSLRVGDKIFQTDLELIDNEKILKFRFLKSMKMLNEISSFSA